MLLMYMQCCVPNKICIDKDTATALQEASLYFLGLKSNGFYIPIWSIFEVNTLILESLRRSILMQVVHGTTTLG